MPDINFHLVDFNQACVFWRKYRCGAEKQSLARLAELHMAVFANSHSDLHAWCVLINHHPGGIHSLAIVPELVILLQGFQASCVALGNECEFDAIIRKGKTPEVVASPADRISVSFLKVHQQYEILRGGILSFPRLFDYHLGSFLVKGILKYIRKNHLFAS